MSKLAEWIGLASANERRKLVKGAKISTTTLYQVARGARSASADVAGRIEVTLQNLGLGKESRLPDINRTDICDACAKCPYALKCLKKEK